MDVDWTRLDCMQSRWLGCSTEGTMAMDVNVDTDIDGDENVAIDRSCFSSSPKAIPLDKKQ